MNLLSFPKLIFYSDAVWPELERLRLPLARFLTLVILPLSLLPPVMLYHAGSNYGEAFGIGFGSKPWGVIASVFFFTELITVLLMGWLIRQVALSHKLQISTHDAFMLASIAPIPMWLSSICLLLPSIALDAFIAFVALAAGCGILYHGILALCHMQEEVSAAEITQTVLGAGIICWALLLVLIVAL